MRVRENARQVEIVDACLGGEHSDGKTVRGSEKGPFRRSGAGHADGQP
jgi:hypothetical protein